MLREHTESCLMVMLHDKGNARFHRGGDVLKKAPKAYTYMYKARAYTYMYKGGDEGHNRGLSRHNAYGDAIACIGTITRRMVSANIAVFDISDCTRRSMREVRNRRYGLHPDDAGNSTCSMPIGRSVSKLE